MIKPRNNWVVVRLIEKASTKQGSIVIPATKDTFSEAEVIAIGEGSIACEGGRPDTHDLKVGQLVFMKHKHPGPRGELAYRGIPYLAGGHHYYIYDQSDVLAILADTAPVAEAYDDFDAVKIAKPPGIVLAN